MSMHYIYKQIKSRDYETVSVELEWLMFAPETFHDLIISTNAGVGVGKDLLSLPSFISSDMWDPL